LIQTRIKLRNFQKEFLFGEYSNKSDNVKVIKL
jgi:hypothetical protein